VLARTTSTDYTVTSFLFHTPEISIAQDSVHVVFGDVIDQDFDTPEALAEEIDRQIHENYTLFPINKLAAGLEDEFITGTTRATLQDKLDALPEGAHPFLIDSYANPVKNIIKEREKLSA
ncbi:hypothetical protein ACPV5M_08665, partial [Vibrio mediterranei]